MARRVLCVTLAFTVAIFAALSSLPQPARSALGGTQRAERSATLLAACAVACAPIGSYKLERPSAAPPEDAFAHAYSSPHIALARLHARFIAHTGSILELTINHPRLAPPFRRL